MSWTVSTVMTRDVVTVPPDATYKEVARRLHERGVSALPVVDADRRVVGIVSEADLLLKEEERPRGALQDARGDAARAGARSASALMATPVVTVEPDATLRHAARLMHRRHVKRLPVVGPEGELVGIVSRADLLMAFLRSDASIATEVRQSAFRTMSIAEDEVAVAVDDGVVCLEGRLETRSLVATLVRMVASVEGVVGVDDRLRWKFDDSGICPEASRRPAAERRRR